MKLQSLMSVKEYYKSPEIKKRMSEYMGKTKYSDMTCKYITRCDKDVGYGTKKEPHELDYYLENGYDIGRSLWDRKSIIAHLDIEYVNFDFPAEPFLDYERTFALEIPVAEKTHMVLTGNGIQPLCLLSGRGHHFVWQVKKNTYAYKLLRNIAYISDGMERRNKMVSETMRDAVGYADGRAFAGLGLMMEYVSHLIVKTAANISKIPVELGAVKVGPQKRGREIISIDITEYADPLDTRMIRVPFSVYLKPWSDAVMCPDTLRDQINMIVMIPIENVKDTINISVMRDMKKCVELAKSVSTEIPQQPIGTQKLIEKYIQSSLREYHSWYYSVKHDGAHIWEKTYDRFEMNLIPPCVSHILSNPNELLLKPVAIRQVVCCMLALGWHPRHIAGLIRSKYERDYAWGKQWYIYNAESRADFYVRLYAGLIREGLDDLIDINCMSAKEKQICFRINESCDLEKYRASVLKRREYERLARRPFNRLFL